MIVKFTEGDKLTWDYFFKHVKKCKSIIVENPQFPLCFSSIGGITVEESTHKMKEEYGI